MEQVWLIIIGVASRGTDVVLSRINAVAWSAEFCLFVLA